MDVPDLKYTARRWAKGNNLKNDTVELVSTALGFVIGMALVFAILFLVWYGTMTLLPVFLSPERTSEVREALTFWRFVVGLLIVKVIIRFLTPSRN